MVDPTSAGNQNITQDSSTDNETVDSDKGMEDPLKQPKRLIYGSLLILIGFIFSILIIYWLNSLFSLGIAGIAIFFVVLVGADIFSGTTRLDTGEIRKAITVSFISVYFLWLGFLTGSISNSAADNSLLNNFWSIIVVIIGFYFGGRTAEEIVNKVKGPGSSNDQNAPASTENQ